MINWQPIDTAPKDNKRPLFLAHFNAAGGLVDMDFNAIWEREQESWELPEYYYIWMSEHGRVEEPTHWAYMDADPQLARSRVFVDMDGVIVDFDAYKTAHGLTGEEVKSKPGAYLAMPAIPGAIEAVRSVIGMGFEVWIATKPPTGVPYAYSDKAAWIMEHLPELKRRIIVTHDKGLLGGEHDFLCDDRPHKANCERFAGTLLRFVDGYHWPEALTDLRAARDAGKAAR